MIVGCGLGNADSARGGTQRQRLVALGFEYVASGANECGPQRSVMVLAGLLMGRFVPGMNLCVFRLCRHSCNIAGADRKGQPILTLLIFMLEFVNGVNIGSKGRCSMQIHAVGCSSSHGHSRHGHSRVALRFVGALAVASLMGSIGMAADSPATAALTVHFVGLKSSQGAVMVAMYNSQEAYEGSGTASEAATRAVRLEIKDGTAVATLAGLSPG